MRAESLLSDEARAAVAEAVARAERATSGEIVPMLVARSDSYADLRAGASALLSLAAGALLLAVAPRLARWIVPTQIGVFAAAVWVLHWRPLLRALVPARLATARVHRAAVLAFHDQGLRETRDRTGILLYVSLLERRVVVLADRGIHARVPDGTWDDVVYRVLDGIRKRRADDGLCDAIRLCGEHLATHFPPRPDDANELADGPRGA
jgi:putative membrane protein